VHLHLPGQQRRGVAADRAASQPRPPPEGALPESTRDGSVPTAWHRRRHLRALHPLEYISKSRWCTSLGGDGPYDRKVLFEIETFGGGSLAPHYRANSPCESTIYPQVRLEPLLREHAESLPLGKLWFNCSLVDLQQDAEGVTARVEDRSTGEQHTVRSRYLVAADAGKTVGPLIGAKLEGTPELVDMVTIYFQADLSKYLDDDHSFA